MDGGRDLGPDTTLGRPPAAAERREAQRKSVRRHRCRSSRERHSEDSPAGSDEDRQPDTAIQIISSMESSTSTSAEEEIAEEAPSDSQEPTASKPQQQRRPQKRKRTTAAETFRRTLLEQQGRLISALEQAAKDDQALRERQVNAQEKLVDLLSQYFSK
ncbi:hypothetical protein HPB50_029550 [Hyalomma asiaticum]|nr:hypothetical protein HPB50_029550 [Hyalomma asiaticum]